MKQNSQGIKVVVIGGGTGTFTVLSSLKHFVQDITAVITMSDDGGSTGVLRDELGVLPPGDVRQCLVALSSSSDTMRELFNYRFGEGTFKGHAFGNIFLTALEKMTGSFAKATVTAGEILNIAGQVLPVTTENIRLIARREDGTEIVGQKNITFTPLKNHEQVSFLLSPKAKLNPLAKEAILKADLVVVGPGNLHASLISALLPVGMKEAFQKTKAKKVFLCNLVNKPGQTDDFSVIDYLVELEKYVGKGAFDYVAYNTQIPPESLLKKYSLAGETLVPFRADEAKTAHAELIGEKLISTKHRAQNKNDVFLKRSLIRHDGDKLARLLMKIYFS